MGCHSGKAAQAATSIPPSKTLLDANSPIKNGEDDLMPKHKVQARSETSPSRQAVSSQSSPVNYEEHIESRVSKSLAAEFEREKDSTPGNDARTPVAEVAEQPRPGDSTVTDAVDNEDQYKIADEELLLQCIQQQLAQDEKAGIIRVGATAQKRVSFADGLPECVANPFSIEELHAAFTEQFDIGDTVQFRDACELYWRTGSVTSVTPLKVQPDGSMFSCAWHEVRHPVTEDSDDEEESDSETAIVAKRCLDNQVFDLHVEEKDLVLQGLSVFAGTVATGRRRQRFLACC